MSIKVVAYVPALGGAMLPRIAEQFSAAGMECEFSPQFSLNSGTDSGVVLVRLRMGHNDVLSSFEIAFKDFRYSAPLSVNPAINEKLKTCTKQVIIRMHANPTSALRTGLYFAAFLAQVTDGIVYAPRSDEFLEPAEATAQFTKEISTYEAELPPAERHEVPFTGWC